MCRLNKISGIFLFVMGLSLSILAVASESQDWLDKGVVQYQRENYDEALELIIWRLRGIVIENRPGIEVMAQQDTQETLHYVDPPYMWETRSKARNSSRKNYRHEMSDADHAQLLSFLPTLKGMVVLSGYAAPLYDSALAGWRKVERTAMADGARPRIECLWINPAAQAGLGAGPLFGEAA